MRLRSKIARRFTADWTAGIYCLIVCGLVVGISPAAAEDQTSGFPDVEHPEVVGLLNQVESLVEALAVARSEIDALRGQLEQYQLGSDETVSIKPASFAKQHSLPYRVSDVNRGLRMIVLNAGKQHGIRPGMQFVVLRDRLAVAEVRVVDVRAGVAGAAIVDLKSKEFPQVGDALIAGPAVEI